MSLQQVIELKLRSFDHRVLDQAVGDIISTVFRTGANVRGPIPLPREIQKFTVNRSTHVNKKSREQFEIREHKRLIIIDSTPQTIDAMMKLDLPSGVEVEIKLTGAGHE